MIQSLSRRRKVLKSLACGPDWHDGEFYVSIARCAYGCIWGNQGFESSRVALQIFKIRHSSPTP